MSSPEKQVENDENIPSQLTESKTPQQARQGKRVPIESPYSWATPSHRKPLKQSRQPVFVADVNLEQTFVEQDTIMMFQRNATFNESSDYGNVSQTEPANDSNEKPFLFSLNREDESQSSYTEPSEFDAIPEETDSSESDGFKRKSLAHETKSVTAEGGDMVENTEDPHDVQPSTPSDLKTDQLIITNSCELEKDVYTSLEISGELQGNSLAAELDAVAISEPVVSVSVDCIEAKLTNDDESEEAENNCAKETTEHILEEAGGSCHAEDCDVGHNALAEVAESNDCNDVKGADETVEEEYSSSHCSSDAVKTVTDCLESIPLCENVSIPITNSDNEASQLTEEMESTSREYCSVTQPDAAFSVVAEGVPEFGESLAAEINDVELQCEVESESSSVDQAELASSESATSLQVEIDNTDRELDIDMGEEKPSSLQSEIESSDSAANLSSEEMDEPTNVPAESNQTAEETFATNVTADYAESTSNTDRQVCWETFNVSTSNTVQTVQNQNRKSFADISVIKPDNDVNESVGSEDRDQFDENRVLQAYTTPVKGQFSDSMVEFVMLENNFSLETEQELKSQLSKMKASMKELNEQVESLTSENHDLKNKLNLEALTGDVNNQTCELTQTNVPLLEKISELESVIQCLRQEHNHEICFDFSIINFFYLQVENVTSKLINTTKELDSLRFDNRRNDSSIELERAADLERMLDEMRTKNEELQKLDSAKNLLMIDLENSLAESKSELVLMKERLDSDTGFLTDTLQQKKQQISSLQKEIEDCRSKVSESETVFDELSCILSGNVDSEDHSEEKSFELKCQLLKSQVLLLQETSLELKKTGNENAERVSETQSNVEVLKNELESVKALLTTTQEKFEEEKRTYVECNNTSQKQIEELTSNIESLKTSVDDLLALKSELELKLVNLEQELSEARLISTQHQEELSKTVKQCDDLRAEVETKSHEVVELLAKDSSSTGLVEDLRSELRAKEADYSEKIELLNSECVLKENASTEEISRLKSELESKESLSVEVEQLKMELETKSRKLEEQTESLKSAESLRIEVENIKLVASSLEEEKMTMKSQIDLLEGDLARDNQEIAELRNNNVRITEELDDLKEKNQKSASVLKLKEQELAETVPKLRKELTDLTVIVVELETKLVESMAKSTSLEDEVIKIKEDSVKQEAELEEKLLESRRKVSELECELNKANVMISEMTDKATLERKANEDIQSGFESLKTELEEKLEIISQNQKEIDRLGSVEQEAKKQLQESNERFTEIEEFYERARNEITQLKTDLVDETKKSVSIAQEFEKFRLNFEELKEDLRMKEEKLKELETNKNEETGMRTELDSVRAQLTTAQNTIAQFEAIVQKGELEFNKLLQEKSSLEATVVSLKAENLLQSESISQLQEETSRLLSAVNDNSKLEEKNKIIASLSTEKIQLEEKIESITKELEKIENNLTSLTVDFTNEKSKAESLMEEVNELRSEKASLQRAHQPATLTVDINTLTVELQETKRRVAELEEKSSSQDNEVERLYKMCDEFDDIESELKQTIAEQDEEILALKKKCGDSPPDQSGGLLDVLKKGVKPLTPNTSASQPVANIATPDDEDDDMEEGEGFSSAPSSPTKKGTDNNITMSTTMSSTMYKRIHNDQTIKSPAKDVNSSRCAQQ
ncbi:unnamed protein product [Auanema sp. JU1783]|nr:unnamed protein product [Auanema sp. JU1783]